MNSEQIHSLARETVIAGFDGTHLDSDLAAAFSRHRFGGFILFARNVESLAGVRALTDALRACYAGGPAPIVAIDQEGGRVVRIRDGVEAMPSMMALGATGDADLARRAGARVAFDLRRAGCTLNCAPVLDVAVEPDNTAIGTRALGGETGPVIALGSAFAAGLESGGIVATPKHFPGHGSTARDSHVELPVLELAEPNWRERDLLPFKALAPHARAMMSAHVVLHALDPWNPATLSRRLLTTVLRDELHFNGVCLTDCLQMDAVAETVGTPAGAAAAIAAGADGVLVSRSPEAALAAAERIARDVPPGRLQQAVTRMRALRSSTSAPLPISCAAGDPDIGHEIARRAVTLLRGEAQADPTNCVAVSFEGTVEDGAGNPAERRASLLAHAPALKEERLPLDPAPERVRDAIDRWSAVRRPIVLVRHARRFPRQAGAIRALIRECPDAIIVAVREPFDLEVIEGARHVIATYGDEAVSLAGLAAVLFGGVAANGVLPVRLQLAR